jgi:hypothetical protein
MPTLLKAILAGGEAALPTDTPSRRLDTAGEFGFVGSLAISNGSATYKGSAVALSPEWIRFLSPSLLPLRALRLCVSLHHWPPAGVEQAGSPFSMTGWKPILHSLIFLCVFLCVLCASAFRFIIGLPLA